MAGNNSKYLVLTLGPHHEKPWWWKWLDLEKRSCDIDYRRVSFKGKKSSEISIFEIPRLMLCLLRVLAGARSSYDYLFTFECDWTSLIISLFQTSLNMKRPRHVILQFIMREKDNTIKSRLKYALMSYLFSSVHMVICSSTLERDYYVRTFGWKDEKVKFVPFHTDPDFLSHPPCESENYIISVGRTFRDHETLVKSVTGTGIPTIIVASRPPATRLPDNVTFLKNVPLSRVTDLLACSTITVLPLEDRNISTGQTVLLHAMVLGKPVIATRTSGTIDYIDHMKTGILVPPYNADMLKSAILHLWNDAQARTELGERAREQAVSSHLPIHYLSGVSSVIHAGIDIQHNYQLHCPPKYYKGYIAE